MNLLDRSAFWFLKLATGIIFRIKDQPLERVPARGPLILLINHVNIMEAPILYTHLQPRPIVGMVLSTRWKNPILNWWFTASGAIPLERGGMNLDNIQKGVEALRKGSILVIAPEGTRSHNGCLQAGHSGMLPLAIKSGAPLLPVVNFGGENYPENLKRLRRTDFNIAVGRLFRLTTRGQALDRQVRQQMTDEIMYQLAAILPAAYRGQYADLSRATQNYIRWE